MDYESMTLAQLRKTDTYIKTNISIPGRPKTRMNKAELIEFLKDADKHKNRKTRTRSRTPARDRSVSRGRKMNKGRNVTPSVSLESWTRIPEYITPEMKQKILNRLEIFRILYTFKCDGRRYGYENAFNSLESSKSLNLDKILNLKYIGPFISSEIIKVVKNKRSDILEQLLNDEEFLARKRDMEFILNNLD